MASALDARIAAMNSGHPRSLDRIGPGPIPTLEAVRGCHLSDCATKAIASIPEWVVVWVVAEVGVDGNRPWTSSPRFPPWGECSAAIWPICVSEPMLAIWNLLNEPARRSAVHRCEVFRSSPLRDLDQDAPRRPRFYQLMRGSNLFKREPGGNVGTEAFVEEGLGEDSSRLGLGRRWEIVAPK